MIGNEGGIGTVRKQIRGSMVPTLPGRAQLSPNIALTKFGHFKGISNPINELQIKPSSKQRTPIVKSISSDSDYSKPASDRFP